MNLCSCVSLSVFVLHAHRSNLFEVAVQQSRLQVRLVFALFGGVGAVRFCGRFDWSARGVCGVEEPGKHGKGWGGLFIS